jgi:hypothetical protein
MPRVILDIHDTLHTNTCPLLLRSWTVDLDSFSFFSGGSS